MRSYFEGELDDSVRDHAASLRTSARPCSTGCDGRCRFFLVTSLDYTVTRRLNFGADWRLGRSALGSRQAQNRVAGGTLIHSKPRSIRSKYGLMKSQHLGAELIDQERAAGADDLRRRLADRLADARRKGREGQARQDIIGIVEAAVGEDLLDVGGRAGDRDQPRIVDRFLEVVGEIGVGVDRQQGRVGAELVEDRPGEGADARAIFDEQLGVRPSRPGRASCRSARGSTG